MLRELGLAAAILVSTAAIRPADPERPFFVIVNRSNSVSSLTRAEVSAMFMKKVRSWPGGAEVVPVDQPATATVREQFSRHVHGKGVSFVTRYWQRLIFAGRAIPPAEGSSDEAVIALVSRNPGGIGYIGSRDTAVDGVKFIAVTP